MAGHREGIPWVLVEGRDRIRGGEHTNLLKSSMIKEPLENPTAHLYGLDREINTHLYRPQSEFGLLKFDKYLCTVLLNCFCFKTQILHWALSGFKILENIS